MISFYDLKPRFPAMLRPLIGFLAGVGVNHVRFCAASILPGWCGHRL